MDFLHCGVLVYQVSAFMHHQLNFEMYHVFYWEPVNCPTVQR